MFRSCCVSSINDTVVVQVFQLPSDCAGIINPRCSLEPNHSDGIQSLCLNGTCLFSGGRDMSIMKWDLTDIPQLKQVLQHHFHYYVFINPLDSKGNYSATSNNTKLVHWPLMQWAVTYGTAKRGLGRAPTCPGPFWSIKCNSPPNSGQCTNHCIAMWLSVAMQF